MKRSTVAEIISFLFIILFLYTGISKLMDFVVFKEQIAQSQILKPLSLWIAWLLPITECTIVVLLFLPVSRLKGLYATLGLMFIFTVYVIVILNFSPHLPCSCGGVLESMSWRMHLVFNISLTILALIGVFLERSQKKINLNIKAS